MSLEGLFQEFVSYAEDRGLLIEGIAVGDENRVLLEHRFLPDLPRNIYSHTKSYLSTAVGIAIDENRLSLDDRLADCFPENVPEDPHPWLLEITLRDLLMMSSGLGKAYLMSSDRRTGIGLPDYPAYLMSQEMAAEPGSRFLYSNGDTVLAARMLEKAVGMPLGEYLYRRIFSKLGQGWPIWEHDASGHAFGAGGLYMRLTEMMKLGQLYLAGGMWEGEQIVSEGWIEEATALQIPTGETDDRKWWSCGYGYQFWRSPYPDSYRADGAYGQITTVLPQAGLVVAVQCPEYGDFEKVWRALDTEFLGRL